jgi:hypothetical protein
MLFKLFLYIRYLVIAVLSMGERLVSKRMMGYGVFTRRRIQPPMFSGYNRKVATTTCPCPVLPS